MSRKKKYTVVANFDTSSPSIEHEGKCPFRINVRIMGEVKPYYTGFAYMDKKYWVHEIKDCGAKSRKMRIQDIKGNGDAKRLIREVAAKELFIVGVWDKMVEAKQAITYAALAEKLPGMKAQSLVEFCEFRRAREEGKNTAGTLKTWNQNIRRLAIFDASVMLKEIDKNWLMRFWVR